MDPALSSVIDPLLAPLRGIATVDECLREGRLQSTCAGITLCLPVESSAEELRAIRGAIELLHLLWHMDRDAWRDALKRAASVRFPGSLVLLETTEAPHIVLSLHHDKFPWQVNNERWMEIVRSSSAVEFPDGWMDARTRLIAAFGGNDVCNGQRCTIPLRLQFLVFGMATAVVPEYMDKVVEMVAAVRQELDHLPDGIDHVANMELDALTIDVSAYEMTSAIAAQLLRLHSLGIRFHQLTIRLCESESYENPMPTADYHQLLTTLVPPKDSSHASEGEFTVRTLVIDRADLDPFQIVCEAIENTAAVKYLQLRNVFLFDTAEVRAVKWQALAHAVFSPTSRTSVKHLGISQINFRHDDVDAVLSVVDPAQQGSSHQADGTHALQSVDIGCEASQDSTIRAIPRLLSVIGAHLRCLSVYSWMGEIDNDSLREIIAACPHLELLDVANLRLPSMDAVMAMLQRPECCLRSLGLHNIEVPHDQVEVFVNTLRQQTPPCLKDLCLDAIGLENEFDSRSVEAIASFLETNQSLEYVELRVDASLVDQSKQSVEKYDGAWLPVTLHPLAMAAKLGFLSLLPRFHQPHSGVSPALSQVLEEVGESIVMIIFQFAATPARRRVYVEEL